MNTMTKPKPLHVGDPVILADNPQFVIRVGYPKTVADYKPLVYEANRNLIRTVIDCHAGPRSQSKAIFIAERWINDLAYLEMIKDRCGGPERSIHLTDPIPALAGCSFLITSLRTVKTGIYYGPSGGSHEYDPEPGGLDKCKTHRLVRLNTDHRVPWTTKQYLALDQVQDTLSKHRIYWLEVGVN